MSGAIWPLYFRWDGDAMIPEPRYKHRCDEQYVVGEVYRLTHEEERSQASHNHYFAAVHEGWVNLREDIADRFKNADHLRKWCLIKNGYCSDSKFRCASHAEATAVAAFIALREPYAVIIVEGEWVQIFVAESQANAVMGGKRFQLSKQAVLDTISSMVNVSVAQLEHEGAQRRYG